MKKVSVFGNAARRCLSVCVVVGTCVFGTAVSYADWVLDTVAGTPGVTAFVDGGLGSMPDVAVDSNGTLYVAGGVSQRYVIRIDSEGNRSIFAGTGNADPFVASGPATSLNITPMGVDVDEVGNVYIADRGNGILYRVDASTGVGTVLAGSLGELGQVACVAVMDSDNIFAAATGGTNRRVFHVNAAGVVTNVAGTGSGSSGSLVSGPASGISISPASIAIESPNTLLVASQSPNNLWRIILDEEEAELLTPVSLEHLIGVAPWTNGEVLLTTASGGHLQVLHTDGTITTIAGTGDIGPYNGAGPDPLATNVAPFRLWTDGETILFTDPAHSLIRRLVAANDAPVLGTLLVEPAVVDFSGNYSISGTFSDSDAGDSHTVTIDPGNGDDPVVLTLDVGQRSFGPIAFTAPSVSTVINGSVEVSDGSAMDQDTFSITVEDLTPPVIESLSSPELFVGTDLEYSYRVTDTASGVVSKTVWLLAPGETDWVSLPTSEFDPAVGEAEGTVTIDIDGVGTSGLWELGIVVVDDAGNSTPVPGDPEFNSIQLLVNIIPNSEFAYDFTVGESVGMFPMHDDGTGVRGVGIFLVGVTSPGSITVSRNPGEVSDMIALGQGLALIDESWSIVASADLEFEFAMLFFMLGEGSLGTLEFEEIDTALRIDGSENAEIISLIGSELEDRTIAVLGVTEFSDWYLGTESAETSVEAWMLLHD